MYYLKTEQSFDSAHFLKGYQGKCSNIHGHRWRVIVEVADKELQTEGPKKGMIIDFGDLKDTLKVMCDELDHSFIYEVGSLRDELVKMLSEDEFRMVQVPFVPTAENFSRFFYEKMKEQNFPVHRVEVYETPNNFAAYEE